ncbi:ferrous iron transport protein A [Marinobacterium sp. MBR-111]|jgi:ferrous iron transport protein A|uniref:FeoA family protein n=1 Tax=Marinobacterium sp. MBR-111 TaxID=3156463 RepID=UPI0033987DB5
MNLTDLKAQQVALILALDGPQSLRQRLAALGILRGQRVELRTKSLWGDPRAYRIGNQKFCLRNAEAQHIWIQLQDD